MKGGWAAAEAADVASEGVQNISTRYERVAKANPPEYILLSAGGEIGAYKNGGDRGSNDDGRGCGALRDSNTHARLC